MSLTCISSFCGSTLHANVPYCPFCGKIQSEPEPLAAITDAPHAAIVEKSAIEAVKNIPVIAAHEFDNIQQAASDGPAPDTVQRHRFSLSHAVTAAIVAIVAAIAAIFYFQTSSAGARCDSPSRNVLVVLDFSSNPSLTVGEIVNRIQNLFDDTRRGERFAVFDTHADAPIFEACFSTLDLSSRSGERRRAIDTVTRAITADTRKPASPSPSQNSLRQKISVKITDLSLTTYLRADRNSLHLVSDLLEGNSATFDTLCEPAGRATENFRTARRGGMEQPAFSNTHIYLHLVPRQDIDPKTLNCRDKYWRWLLSNTSGTGAGVSVEYLPSSIRSNSND